MKITQTLTFAAIPLTVAAWGYCGDSQTPLTRRTARSALHENIRQDQFPVRSVRQLEIAQADKPAAAEKNSTAKNSTQSRDLVTAASDKLKSYSSVRAAISEKVTFQTHSFTAKGSYLQGQNLQLRMELSVELGSQKGSLLELCDGQVLWTRHDLGDKDQTQITRRDVRQILQASEKAEQQMKTPDEKAMFQNAIVADLGIGGLPALLAAFAKDFDFQPPTDGKIDDRDVVVLEGTWNSKYRDMWAGGKAKSNSKDPLPLFMPDLARISLDKETQFPRRIEFLKVVAGQPTPSPLMTVDFTKVVFNGKVNRGDFVFIPPERPAPVDITQVYLQRLTPAKKEAQPAPATKPEKAAKP